MPVSSLSPAWRDSGSMRRAIARVTAAIRDGVNVVPPIIDAVEAKATLGEISDALRSVFGEHEDTGTF